MARRITGLRCRDETGKVILNISDRICRYLGEGSTGFEEGYVTNDAFLENVDVWVLPKSVYLQYVNLSKRNLDWPEFRVSGNRLEWHWHFTDASVAAKEAIDFYYGVY